MAVLIGRGAFGKVYKETFNGVVCAVKKTSLLRRLKAQTLPDATPPMGNIHPFSKMAVTFEPLMGF